MLQIPFISIFKRCRRIAISVSGIISAFFQCYPDNIFRWRHRTWRWADSAYASTSFCAYKYWQATTSPWWQAWRFGGFTLRRRRRRFFERSVTPARSIMSVNVVGFLFPFPSVKTALKPCRGGIHIAKYYRSLK